MFRFILKRIFQGGFVLAGVVVAVFCLFYVLPGDPARGGMGNHVDEETLKAIRADLGLDQPMSIQFLSYINDLSPISIHNTVDSKSPFYLDPNEYAPYIELYKFESKVEETP